MAIMNQIETLRTRIHAEMQVKQTGAVYDNLTYPVQTGAAAFVAAATPPRWERRTKHVNAGRDSKTGLECVVVFEL